MPGLRTSGAIPYFPLYAFLVWRGTTFRFLCPFLYISETDTQVHRKMQKQNSDLANRRNTLKESPATVWAFCCYMMIADGCDCSSSVHTAKRRKLSDREHTWCGQICDHKQRFKVRPNASSRPYCFPATMNSRLKCGTRSFNIVADEGL